MVDIDTHRIVDLIDSRDCEVVTEWLKSYPNLQVISRDGSVTYNNAITLAHPNAIQVSDRFHILQNLTSYCKDYLIKYFEPKVIIEVDTKPEAIHVDTNPTIENKKLTLAEKYEKAFLLLQEGLGKSKVCQQLNMDIRVLNKLLAMNDEERVSYFKSNLQKSHEDKVNNKIQLISTVKDMFKNNYSIRAIAKELGISRPTVKRYLDENASAVNAGYGVKRKSILDPFIHEINELIDKGHTSSEIGDIIKKKGYRGSESTIRHYKAQLKKSNYEINKITASTVATDIIERSQLLKLLYKPISMIKGLSDEYLDKVNNKYPVYKQVIDIVNEFREILKNKAVNAIDPWMAKASLLNNKYINSFINGLTRDIIAVKNAIIYEYNNGLAEGSVNKLKVIKRIMYGRNSFDMLRKKLLRLEKSRKFN